MANDIADLLLRIDATTEGLRRELKRAEDAVSDGGAQIEKNTKKIDDSFSKMSDGVGKSLRLVGTALAALGVGLSVRAVTEYADAWQSATNQLKTVQKETESLTNTQNMLMAVANESRAGFETTANLYARLSRSTESLNLTQIELIDLTETINKSFAVSGATAQEASNAITQLAQGLAAGALRGDEFNSVSEQSPILMQAIADSLRMTRGELRAFASEGGITAEIVVTALQQASGEIDRTFSKMSATFEQNMTVAKNNMLEFVGSSKTVQQVTSATGGAIVTLSENIDELGNIMAAAGIAVGAMGAVHLVRLVASINAATAAQTLFNRAVAINPYVLAGTALATLSYAVIKYTEDSREAAAATRDLMNSTYDLLNTIDLNEVKITSLDEAMRNVVLTNIENQRATQASTAAVVTSTARTAEEIEALRKKAVQLDHGRYSTGALTQASQELIGKLSTVRMSYEDMIPLLAQTEWRMQGVTNSTYSQADATEFWTKVSQQGAERRAAAEIESQKRQEEAIARTHEYLTTSFIDIFNNGKNAFDNIAKAFSAMIQRMLAEWAASKLMEFVGIGSGSMGGGSAGGTVASIASNAVANAAAKAVTGGTAGAAVGQFIGGATGSAVGAGSALAGPPTAAAATGSGIAASIAGGVKAVGSAISSGASATTAFIAANPLLAAAAVAAAAAAALAEKPTYSSNAGLLIHDAPGASADRKFAVDPFESGFSPIGFARREDQSAANEVIDVFRNYDASLTEIAKAAGLNVDFSNNPFGGYNEKGQANGLFLGTAAEQGKGITSAPMQQQLTQFTKQWVQALGGQVAPADREFLLSSTSADQLLERAAELGQAEMGRLHGSHADGLDYVPFDGYRAELHRGERVLTASENTQMSAMSGKMDALMMQVALYSRRMSQVIDDWDSRGLPPERLA